MSDTENIPVGEEKRNAEHPAGSLANTVSVFARLAEAGKNKFGLVDFLVILICFSTAAVSIFLFRHDLMRTIDSFDEEPAGVIVIRNNVVQRRHADRVLWDRIFVDSPVYEGDLIRAAELSAATVYLDENQIDLNQNTLIQIQHSQGGKGPLQIELQEGNLSLTAADTGIILNLMGRVIQTEAGTVLNAEKGEEGIVVRVNEGNAIFIEEGRSLDLSEGTVIAQDTTGAERVIPMAVVKNPRPNAQYLKNSPEDLHIDFVWNNINIDAGETLHLEIAGDPKFVKSIKIINNLDNRAQADFDTGLWYWRLFYGNTVLSAGQLTVTDASGPELLSPAGGSMFRYQNDPPGLRFQWSQKSGASHYIIEIASASTDGKTPDFSNPQISGQSASASFIQPAPGPGLWYWRVRPVFPSVYEGGAQRAGYSAAASFRIEQTSDPQAPALELPVSSAQMPPASVPPPARAPAGNRAVPGTHYSVQSGDTLADIAYRAYTIAKYLEIIAEANDLENPDLIEIGDVLYLPPE